MTGRACQWTAQKLERLGSGHMRKQTLHVFPEPNSSKNKQTNRYTIKHTHKKKKGKQKNITKEQTTYL